MYVNFLYINTSSSRQDEGDHPGTAFASRLPPHLRTMDLPKIFCIFLKRMENLSISVLIDDILCVNLHVSSCICNRGVVGKWSNQRERHVSIQLFNMFVQESHLATSCFMHLLQHLPPEPSWSTHVQPGCWLIRWMQNNWDVNETRVTCVPRKTRNIYVPIAMMHMSHFHIPLF
jgi:hypothetical protein